MPGSERPVLGDLVVVPRLLRVVSAALIAVTCLASCDKGSRQDRFCKKLAEDQSLLAVVPADPGDLDDFVSRYRELDDIAPLAIEDQWHTVTELVAAVATADLQDPTAADRLRDQAVAATRSVDEVRRVRPDDVRRGPARRRGRIHDDDHRGARGDRTITSVHGASDTARHRAPDRPLTTLGTGGQTASARLTMTLSIMPYTLACSAVNQRSRSESAVICSTGWPVWKAMSSAMRRLVKVSCSAWMAMSGSLAAEAGRRLMHHDPGVGKRVALAGRAGAEQELAHRGGKAEADGGHVTADELHGVVDGHARGDRAPRAVDVHPDVLAGLLGVEEEQLRADLVGDVIVDVRSQHHDAALEKLVEDVGLGVAGGRLERDGEDHL